MLTCPEPPRSDRVGQRASHGTVNRVLYVSVAYHICKLFWFQLLPEPDTGSSRLEWLMSVGNILLFRQVYLMWHNFIARKYTLAHFSRCATFSIVLVIVKKCCPWQTGQSAVWRWPSPGLLAVCCFLFVRQGSTCVVLSDLSFDMWKRWPSNLQELTCFHLWVLELWVVTLPSPRFVVSYHFSVFRQWHIANLSLPLKAIFWFVTETEELRS